MEGYFLDANLFVLLVVGSESRDLISKHRHLRDYTAEGYDVLIELLENAHRLFVTPNTLTETSNLLRQHGEPKRSLLMRRLQYLIHDSCEVVTANAETRPLIREVCERQGYASPEICTPNELMGVTGDA